MDARVKELDWLRPHKNKKIMTSRVPKFQQLLRDKIPLLEFASQSLSDVHGCEDILVPWTDSEKMHTLSGTREFIDCRSATGKEKKCYHGLCVSVRMSSLDSRGISSPSQAVFSYRPQKLSYNRPSDSLSATSRSQKIR